MNTSIPPHNFLEFFQPSLTTGNLTFYKLYGDYFVRAKSSLMELATLGFVVNEHNTPVDKNKLPPNPEAWLLAEPIRANHKTARSDYYVNRKGIRKQTGVHIPASTFTKSFRKVDIYVKSPKFQILEALRLYIIGNNIKFD
jgi:hypothetical protein